MRRFLLLFCVLVNYLMYSQLVWEQPNNGVSSTISIGDFPMWEMTDPTLNGAPMPEGALIGVFYQVDGEFLCGAFGTWPGSGSGMIAISPQGDDSMTPEVDGFSAGESYNWFVQYNGVDYYSSNAMMVEPNGQLTGTVYNASELCGLKSADFTEWTGESEEEEVLSCECAYGMAIENAGMCMILNACSDPLASNYCPGPEGTQYFSEQCQYDNATEGCVCPDAYNYDATASIDDGSCLILSGGCGNPLADNYSGDECSSATFLDENCIVSGCMCPGATNYNVEATLDDGSCVVLSGGCGDPLADNYSGDVCATAYFISEDCQYGPIDVNLDWEYSITDGNMTVQVGQEAILFNGQEPPCGSLLGGFYTNDSGDLMCAGYRTWCDDFDNGQLAISLWASESGFDNGFTNGEEITWALQIGENSFLADDVEYGLVGIVPGFTDVFTANGFAQIVEANFSGEVTGILGCTDFEAYNYNSEATVDDGSCYNLDWNVVATDCNMTILIQQTDIDALSIALNQSSIPAGSVIGVFYENSDGQLVCGGSTVWTQTATSLPVWGSESGLDNGFQSGEELTNWALLIGDQTIAMDENGATMGLEFGPGSDTYTCNGFGNLNSVNFEGEYELTYGCTDEAACNYDALAIMDDDSCYFEQTLYQDSDEDGLGNPDLSITSCDEVAGFVTNNEDPCPNNIDNPNNTVVWYYDEDGDGLGGDEFSLPGCDLPGPDFADNADDPCPYNALNIGGCIDQAAYNYNSEACYDDGSCIAAILGCTDPSSFNYNEDANTDDGTCEAVLSGCTDMFAFNYNENANTDDDSCCYIAGCTDSAAFNYNALACYDNGACEAVVAGCTDPSSFNYNIEANTDDGTCEDYVYGCLDNLACNYNENANTDDGLCSYAEAYYNCAGDCVLDVDGDGVCDELEVLGCTDFEAFNYDSLATDDDGSCIAVVLGCTDISALNYDVNANTDNNNCCYIAGCIDDTAFNYNENACYDDNSCIAVVEGCTDPSAFNYDENANTDNGSCEDYSYGCLDNLACNYDENANTDNGSCVYPEEYYGCDGNCINDIDLDGVCDENEVGGCTDSNALNYNPDATEDDFCVFTGCLDALACNFDPVGIYDEFAICEYVSCSGCTNSNADNYDSEATIDDGSCIVSGCMDNTACNYDSEATIDNGSCLFAVENFDCDGNCVISIDCNGDCGGDALLDNCGTCDNDDSNDCIQDCAGVWGGSELIDACGDCGGNGPSVVCWDDSIVCDTGDCLVQVVGCIDSNACNYDSEANSDDGSCEYALEGFDCDGNELELDSPWGNSNGCDPFNNHTVAFTGIDNLNAGDFIGLFYTSDSGDLVFAQAVEYIGGTFFFTVCGDDATTVEKDGFDVGESFIWQLWPAGEDCAYTINVEYSEAQSSSGEYEVNGMSQVTSFSGSSLEASVLVTDVQCNGGSGSVELIVTGGIAPYEMDDLSSLSAGSYSTTVTDANGCTVLLDFDITEPELLEASVSVTDALCNGDFGSAELTVTGGTAPYETDDLSSLSTGSYSTTIIDANGCSVTLDFDVTEPELLEASVSVTDPLCSGDVGSAELFVVGGTIPYEMDDLSDLSAGSYTTVVTDANGCEFSVNFDIVEPELLEASVSVIDPLCNGDLGSAELVVIGGTAPYETDTLSDLVAGSYTTVVTDDNGCEVSVDFDIIEPDPIEVVVTTEDVSCNGESNGSVSLDITGGTGDYNYEVQVETQVAQENNYSMSFDGDDELILPNVNDFNDDEFSIQLDAVLETYGVLFQSNGPHVAFTYGENCGCSSPTNDFDVPSISFRLYTGGWTVLSYPVSLLDLSNPINIAATKNGSSVKLYINGVLVDEASSGVSSVSGETAIGYDGFTGLIDNVAIWANSLELNQIEEFMTCPPSGDESELLNYFNFEEGPEDTLYDLSQGANYTSESINNCIISESIFIDDLDNLFAGDYVITAFDSNGCLDVTEFSISEPEELLLTFDSTAGEYANCASGTASVFVEGGSADYEYLWSNGATTSDLVGICGGEYSVIVTDANGCAVEGVVIVDYLVPEGWEVSVTDVTHVIDIPTEAIMLLDQIDLIIGDYLGVFFNNDDGSQSCGGYVILTGDSSQLIAYGNDGNNNGFEQGEQFNWKVWDSSSETTISGFGVYDDLYPDERYFNAGGESGLLGSVSASHQVIPLNESSYSDWDMISTYMSTDEDMESLMAPISNELIIIKDLNGVVYWPALDVYNLENLYFDEAYAIKTYASNELVVHGEFMQPESIPFMLSGWNYISYPRYFPLEVEIALSGADSNIKLLKDDSGNLYWPELGINTIGQMEAGEGYLLKVLSDQEFSYPSNSDHVDQIDGSTSAGRLGLTQTAYYPEIETTSLNMALGFPLDSWGNFEIQYGDELAVFDSQGNIVGVSVLDNDNNAITVWADDLSSHIKDGMLDGEEFILELWQQDSDKIFSVNVEWEEGVNYFNTNGINIASNITVELQKETELSQISCYPNPSSGYFDLEFYLINDDNINISIFNGIGEEVYNLHSTYFNKGVNSIPFDLSSLSQGIYYLEIYSSFDRKMLTINLTN